VNPIAIPACRSEADGMGHHFLLFVSELSFINF